jgi:hypothetical protein
VTAQFAGSPPPDTETNDEAVSLGEGFSSLTRDGTGQFCLGESGGISKILLEYLNDRTYWADFLHTESDIQRKVSGRLDGDVEFGVIQSEVEGHYDGTLDSSTVRDVLTVGMSLRTVKRYIQPSLNFESNYICDSNKVDDNFLGFAEICGDQYVHAEVLGGICLMSADLANLSDQEKEVVKAQFEVGAAGVGSLDMQGRWETINNQISQSLTLKVDCVGIEAPTGNLLTNGKLTADNFDEYLDELKCGEAPSECDGSDEWGYIEAYNASYQEDNSDAIYHSSLGAVIDREFLDYDHNGFIDFCVGDSLDTGEQCFFNFLQTAYHQREQVEDVVERTDEKLANQADYYWGDDEVGAISDWQSFQTDAQDCLSDWTSQLNACDQQLSTNGPPQEVCDACSAPLDCSPEFLEGIEGNLPGVETILSRQSPTDRHDVKQGTSSLSLGYTNDKLCTLSSVRGYFAGGGEKVILDSDSGAWDFSVISQRTEEDEEVAASAICVDTQNFYDGNGNNFTIADTVSESSTGSTETENLNAYPHVAALTGIGGDLDGAGEHVSVIEPDPNTTDPWLLSVYTSAQQTWGWATAFGLDNPYGGQPDWVEKPEYEMTNGASTSDGKIYSVRMAESDEAYCFLTRISGKFRGGGEKVRIYEEEGAWMLEVWAGCESYTWGGLGDDCVERKHVEAKARCIPYDQSS